MQAFVHLTVFALIFVISATAATSPTLAAVTGNTGTAPAGTTAPAGANNTAPAPATPTAPSGANNTAPAPVTPTDANNTAPVTPMAPSGANNTAPAPVTPTDANNTAPVTPTAPAGANNTAPAPVTPTDANNTAPVTPTAPAGANNTAPVTPTAPSGANNTAPAPVTPTDANNTAPVTPTDANNTAPVTPTAPAGANNTAPVTPTAPSGANNTAPAPVTPTDANNTAPVTPTAPSGANNTAPAPVTPTDANNTAPVTPTAPSGANNTAPAPVTPTGANNTAPAPVTPTAPSGANNTAPAPVTPTDANNTAPVTPTAPAGTNNTTPTPATPTAPTTFIKDNSPGTVPSVTSSNVTSLKTRNPNPDTANLCQVDSCAGSSYCVNLNSIHVCLCIDGFYYNSSICKKGKVFPGIIQVKTPDTSGLENEKSINYENLYKKVQEFFEGVFKNSDYGQTVIQRVSISTPARSQMRADDKVVNVTVANLFAEDTKENEMTIAAAIHNATLNSSNIANYTNQDHCEFYGCKKDSNCSNGFYCECQDGYERPNPYTATCLPLSRKCPYACTSKPHMQCLMKDDGSPDCVCLAGYKKDDRETCQACAFGYNGVNCEDNFQLILTILGTIAGILILGMVIALILMRSKKTKDIEEEHLIENDFQNLKLQQTTGFSSPAKGSIFPKVTASFPRDGGMQNPYANPRGMPRPDY